ncbi:site-2 protease family protein [Methanobacterium alcaliphilum]|uniref:site-2 protease family protein n=1 Tax=Methanobacterium alcaliphilum TaxID=392018 RepID=UPI00200ACCE8|nr:site-2 protease family protein [Methanobacterium alcaliphilum]MCK9150345.1 site-2 protease family protein [Methanobacterium alcaliphilum]
MVKFTSREIRDIIISMLVIALVFAFAFSNKNLTLTISLFPITLIAVGLGFVLHELSHKLVAIKYGFWAEYRLWVEGLILALVTSYFGFVFAAPGAVYIHGEYIDKEQNGKISLAGPVTNIILALIFLALIPYVQGSLILSAITQLGFAINSFLAFFNLIPFAILDGAKIFRWNPLIWVIAILIAGSMTFYSMTGGL